jgi:hypothetical protein
MKELSSLFSFLPQRTGGKQLPFQSHDVVSYNGAGAAAKKASGRERLCAADGPGFSGGPENPLEGSSNRFTVIAALFPAAHFCRAKLRLP